MKHWLAPLLALALLLGASLWNARTVAQSVEDWRAALETTLPAAEAEDWDTVRETLDRVYDAWNARQTYFHIMVEHAELDAAEALFAVSRSYAESEEAAEFRANTADLLTQLTLLREMEAVSIRNIL